ncbi:hypothetical protein [Thiohalorhabdus methylotrophus]|uniref:Lipoprotein SmpA/OmlA domain-containing protein n=1 Tax=Thiohalorhabdus methylotrophus TaxID=3242694 RepID=A0ABV4TXY7_9GAMM
MIRRLPVLVVLAMLAAGCAQVDVGKDFDLQAFEERVEVGETERTDVRQWLGEPVSTGQVVRPDGTRVEEWTYYYGTGTLPGLSDAQLKMLEIQYRKNGVVDSYKWTGETQ